MRFILHFLVTAGVLFILIHETYISDIIVDNGYISLLIFVVVLGLVNLIFGTILRMITFPLRMLTFGAFSFVISCILVKVTDILVPGITITSVLSLFLVALVVAGVSLLFRVFK